MNVTNNILSVVIPTPNEVAKELAKKVKARRLEMNLTQEGLAVRSGIKFATYRRFEQTGEISLRGLLKIGFAMNALTDFAHLFNKRQYRSLDELINEQKHPRKRGKKNE